MALKCELCGNSEFVKEDGMFVCRGCNTKYSLEDAKKMMDGTEDTGSVGLSTKAENLYKLARRAREDGNDENAAKYYEMVLIENPADWEASFFSVYYKAMGCKIAHIESAANSVKNSIKNIFGLINDNVSNEEEKNKAVEEVCVNVINISVLLYNASVNHHNGIDASIRDKYVQEYLDRCFAAVNTLYRCGNLVESMFGESYAKKYSVPCWKKAISLHSLLVRHLRDKESNKNTILDYESTVQKYDSSYSAPEINTGGCYVATAVYGSYDCPEVWTLRRYRDNTLSSTFSGRTFIKVYYAISPTLVKWFGESRWFKSIFKGRLDKMVKKLNENGVENTPYEDKNY